MYKLLQVTNLKKKQLFTFYLQVLNNKRITWTSKWLGMLYLQTQNSRWEGARWRVSVEQNSRRSVTARGAGRHTTDGSAATPTPPPGTTRQLAVASDFGRTVDPELKLIGRDQLSDN